MNKLLRLAERFEKIADLEDVREEKPLEEEVPGGYERVVETPEGVQPESAELTPEDAQHLLQLSLYATMSNRKLRRSEGFKKLMDKLRSIIDEA